MKMKIVLTSPLKQFVQRMSQISLTVQSEAKYKQSLCTEVLKHCKVQHFDQAYERNDTSTS